MQDSKSANQPARRGFLHGLVATAATATLAGPALAKPAAPASNVYLDAAKWSPRNRELVAALITRHGSASKSYSAKRKPYAVFDWDNTSIMNDCEEALLMYQINHLAFKLTPVEFSAIIRQNVPAGNFTADYKNAAGKQLDLESICTDLDSDYAYLHGNYKGMAGSRSLEDIVETAQFQDFRAKLYFLYEAVNDTHGVNVGYPWVIYFFANMTVGEVSALAEASNDANLGMSLTKTKYSSPSSLPGVAGVITTAHFHGIRLCTEVATLMNTFRQNGFDVYVSTASLEDVVAVFATNPKYGYHVQRENVLGLRLEQNGDVYKNAYRKDWPLNWGPGKSVVIKRELVAKKGYGPVFVAGDSDGDYDMLRDFTETEIGLVVNRLKKGKIGELSKAAADAAKEAHPRFLLQGRQESTGNWLPVETTLKYGKTAPAMLG
ncbi:haloacid dehalogenase-like hydrolase [Undibacterium sp. CY18W]|uniref:phosphoserine phosphatase n=1 Tax=Undibacterium hunanense TaxID=2762292 RepID=A0ABR6ZXN9_9BURK|nr:HAD family hydrolase [Undibacterium hunanense]MBC3920608.1 haloacid dehalogenase-like hydrolase [Undibacterium hunanense]